MEILLQHENTETRKGFQVHVWFKTTEDTVKLEKNQVFLLKPNATHDHPKLTR